jgi:hypothetical protein
VVEDRGRQGSHAGQQASADDAEAGIPDASAKLRDTRLRPARPVRRRHVIELGPQDRLYHCRGEQCQKDMAARRAEKRQHRSASDADGDGVRGRLPSHHGRPPLGPHRHEDRLAESIPQVLDHRHAETNDINPLEGSQAEAQRQPPQAIPTGDRVLLDDAAAGEALKIAVSLARRHARPAGNLAQGSRARQIRQRLEHADRNIHRLNAAALLVFVPRHISCNLPPVR